MALIHVIIPVYNAKPFLQATVASVLNQPCKDIDIVLVDDGSTDGSSILCDEIAGKESRVHAIHQKNAGVSAARNAGIAHFLGCSKDGYIAFLDADDLWCPQIISKEVANTLQRMEQTDVFVFGSTTSNEDCSRYSVPRQYREETVEGGNGVIWKVQGTFCANFYSLQLLREFSIRFIEGLKYSEDKIFALQCLFLARNVTFMPEILHVYRENSTSAMRKLSSYSPIAYYTPIIDGWIASDLFLNQYEPTTGKRTDAGFVLASIYFMDMATEHHRRWKPLRDLDKVKTHPYYYLFENMRENCVSTTQYMHHKQLLEHPIQFAIKNRIIGIVCFIANLALKNKPIYRLRMWQKYPLKQIPKHPQRN